MSYNIDLSLVSSSQIEKTICQRIEQIRISRNITQKQLANEAGVSLKTITRLENGEGVTLNTFIRVISALGLIQNLEEMLPDPALQPLQLIRNSVKPRLRARPQADKRRKQDWKWGDEENKT
ncbi:MAG: helix-turn-helix domain-containing protein [Candidatus Cloacimonetes bacterium]|nr:helix-turn-helix domain-containing protein [Candidatus Cloacimonadota bacterium]